MSRLTAQPGFTPGMVGALCLLQLAVLRFAATADAAHVSVFGHELHWGCWFRQRFGVPCPACGMTRSVLLTLHGQFSLAWQLNWAGPLFVAGLLLIALVLLCVMLCAQVPRARAFGPRLESGLRFSATAYAALFVAVLLAHWVYALHVG